MNHTDLALEAHQQVHTGAGTLPGVRIQQQEENEISITQIKIETDDAAQRLEKPIGQYITLDLAALLRDPSAAPQRAGQVLGLQLAQLLGPAPGPVLIVGLGNAAITPDAIGPRTLPHILVTRHLRRRLPDLFGPLADCCAFAPGVLASTGLESAEIVRGIAQASGAGTLIAVDALAACEEKRLCCTVQLADTGIVPGSGIGNTRTAFDRRTMGVPVIAVGVPTVISAGTLRGDPSQAGLIVTPSDIDARIAHMARILAAGINRALFPHLSEAEIAKLVAP